MIKIFMIVLHPTFPRPQGVSRRQGANPVRQDWRMLEEIGVEVDPGLGWPIAGQQRQAPPRRGPRRRLRPEAAVTQSRRAGIDHLLLMRLDAARSPDSSGKEMILIWLPHRGQRSGSV